MAQAFYSLLSLQQSFQPSACRFPLQLSCSVQEPLPQDPLDPQAQADVNIQASIQACFLALQLCILYPQYPITFGSLQLLPLPCSKSKSWTIRARTCVSFALMVFLRLEHHPLSL